VIVGVFGGAIQCSEGGIASERSGERVLKGDGGRYRPMPVVRRVLRLNSGVLVAGKSLNVYKVSYIAGCMTAVLLEEKKPKLAANGATNCTFQI
jgi:hypothetical protein